MNGETIRIDLPFAMIGKFAPSGVGDLHVLLEGVFTDEQEQTQISFVVNGMGRVICVLPFMFVTVAKAQKG